MIVFIIVSSAPLAGPVVMYVCLCGGARRVPAARQSAAARPAPPCPAAARTPPPPPTTSRWVPRDRSRAAAAAAALLIVPVGLQGRPLCLFYFTHPFGVLSPEPPTVAAAPPHVARAFLNMEPVSPFHFWSSTTGDSYNTATSDSGGAPTAPSTLKYDLGKAKVHESPVQVVSVARARKCTIELGAARDSLSSSLFSSDIWFSSGSSARSFECARRLVPYHRMLPPLQLPPPRDSPWDSSDDVWPSKRVHPEKFSLPPIEMPATKDLPELDIKKNKQLSEVTSVDSGSVRRSSRRLGVRKRKKRLHLSGVRRLVTCLVRRAVRGNARHPHR